MKARKISIKKIYLAELKCFRCAARAQQRLTIAQGVIICNLCLCDECAAVPADKLMEAE